MIKNNWVDIREMVPDENQRIVIIQTGTLMFLSGIFNYEGFYGDEGGFYAKKNILRWIYHKDLMPEGVE